MASQREVRTVVARMKGSLKSFEKDVKWFISVQGWLALGYESLAEFWTAEFGDLPIATGLRNYIIVKMYEDAPRSIYGDGVGRGERQFIADAMGVAPHVVSNAVYQTRKRHSITNTGRGEYESVPIGFMVPNRWRRHVVRVASAEGVNMADILRPMIKEGMKRRHEIDVDAPIEPATTPKKRVRSGK